jgi:hypothetical protein
MIDDVPLDSEPEAKKKEPTAPDEKGEIDENDVSPRTDEGACTADLSREENPSRSIPSTHEEISLSGSFHRSRSAVLRALLLVTGLALLRWIVLESLILVGYRRPATLVLKRHHLDLRLERRFMGVLLGNTHLLLPLSSVRWARLSGGSRIVVLLSSLFVLMFSSGIGTILVTWGISGRQFSWIVWGIGLVGCGILIDAMAYLRTRRGAVDSRGVIEISAAKIRFRLNGVSSEKAELFLEAVQSARAT